MMFNLKQNPQMCYIGKTPQIIDPPVYTALHYNNNNIVGEYYKHKANKTQDKELVPSLLFPLVTQ